MNNQLIIRHENNQEVFDYLANHGFANVHSLTAQNYSFPVIVLDIAAKTFFGTNTTCMAATKPKVLTFEEVREILKGH